MINVKKKNNYKKLCLIYYCIFDIDSIFFISTALKLLKCCAKFHFKTFETSQLYIFVLNTFNTYIGYNIFVS